MMVEEDLQVESSEFLKHFGKKNMKLAEAGSLQLFLWNSITSVSLEDS